jgi:hypothetical protein
MALTWEDVLERVTGIEPALSAWEADVLPLNYTRANHPAVLRPHENATGPVSLRPNIVPERTRGQPHGAGTFAPPPLSSGNAPRAVKS